MAAARDVRNGLSQAFGCSVLGTAAAAKNVSPAAGVVVTATAGGSAVGSKVGGSVLATGQMMSDLITYGVEAV